MGIVTEVTENKILRSNRFSKQSPEVFSVYSGKFLEQYRSETKEYGYAENILNYGGDRPTGVGRIKSIALI